MKVLVPARTFRTGHYVFGRPSGSPVDWPEARDLTDRRRRQEMVLGAELFSASTMASMVGVPVFIGHADEIPRGRVQRVRRDGCWLVADLLVSDGPTASRVRTGELAEVSPEARWRQELVGGARWCPRYVMRDLRFTCVTLGPVGFARGGRSARLLTELAKNLSNERTIR